MYNWYSLICLLNYAAGNIATWSLKHHWRHNFLKLYLLQIIGLYRTNYRTPSPSKITMPLTLTDKLQWYGKDIVQCKQAGEECLPMKEMQAYECSKNFYHIQLAFIIVFLIYIPLQLSAPKVAEYAILEL